MELVEMHGSAEVPLPVNQLGVAVGEPVLDERGRPCIGLPAIYKDKPEDKFFAIEIARYVLQNTYDRLSENFDEDTAKKIDLTIRVLGQVSDEMAELLWNTMKAYGRLRAAFL